MPSSVEISATTSLWRGNSSDIGFGVGTLRTQASMAEIFMPSRNSFDDAQVAFAGVAQHAQRLLVARAVVRGDRLRDALELGHDGALVQPALVCLRGRRRADQETPARRLDRRRGELRVRGERVGVLDRAVTHYPIRLGHALLLLCATWIFLLAN